MKQKITNEDLCSSIKHPIIKYSESPGSDYDDRVLR